LGCETGWGRSFQGAGLAGEVIASVPYGAYNQPRWLANSNNLPLVDLPFLHLGNTMCQWWGLTFVGLCSKVRPNDVISRIVRPTTPVELRPLRRYRS